LEDKAFTLKNMDTQRSNIPEFSVSELAFSMKRTLEENYGRVRVRGELSKVMIAGSGHMYSSLKDDQAVIDAVCWKGTVSKLSVKPAEGLDVICTGRISTYPARSNYQLIIETMELAGQGALLKMLEDRRKKLAAEGLFDQDRKRPLPFLPEVIGIVTSPTGAVIRDILHRLEDRFPRHVIVWPALVQGPGAAEQVAAAIHGFQTIEEHGLPKPDLLIVARGGGSLEDLMPFNEEIVVRAAAASTIPLISAVGHETDTTLIDYASDLRAPTPTGAAEMAVPRRTDILARVLDDQQRMIIGMARLISEFGHKLEARTKALSDPRRLMEIKSQQLDHSAGMLARVFKDYLTAQKTCLITHATRLRTPAERLAQAHLNLVRWHEQLDKAALGMLEKREKNLNHAGHLLNAYSFENVLKRGYTVIRTPEGALITDPADTAPGQTVQIQFSAERLLEATTGALRKK
jgi:exodeoxyribonuclease VII large subunit